MRLPMELYSLDELIKKQKKNTREIGRKCQNYNGVF